VSTPLIAGVIVQRSLEWVLLDVGTNLVQADTPVPSDRLILSFGAGALPGALKAHFGSEPNLVCCTTSTSLLGGRNRDRSLIRVRALNAARIHSSDDVKVSGVIHDACICVLGRRDWRSVQNRVHPGNCSAINVVADDVARRAGCPIERNDIGTGSQRNNRRRICRIACHRNAARESSVCRGRERDGQCGGLIWRQSQSGTDAGGGDTRSRRGHA